ncbi:serine/threonine protein kinase [Streptomyces sp. BHT-5-2]|uniref:serine/threonine-protein kinase n=1 Tax=Streptomyces sp. BHT-5-2 TaxID=2866715 RepID=UPI001C8DF660|nr:serine/threonine-protein kinase [Streptomyces sp. BHT-5-2]QZL06633.1 serine/threonine protein kinase [Streptomyces sp. BHT-5-2]
MEPLTDEDPRTLGGYRLLGRLGAGGMGRVYLGRSAGGRTVAVKAVHAQYAADDQFRARFRREVASARRVGGAWTAPVLDADPDAPVPWVATGYVAGPALSRAITDHGPLADHSVRALGAGLAEALLAVHALGLVHRDVKPSNVLLTLDGPLLIDFGIARATDGTASLTSTGVSVGSPGYMAPEQILGKGAEAAADVFSLGAVLAFAATGAAPFTGDSSAALLYKVVHEEPELGPELTGELRELAAACLAKDPARRPAPEEVAARLAGDGGGAAGLVRAGWLPGPLVEQVSRQAVALLNLDAEGDGGGGVAGPGGGGVGGVAPGTGTGGAFGAPEPSYAAGSGLIPFDTPAQSVGPATETGPGAGGGAAGTDVGTGAGAVAGAGAAAPATWPVAGAPHPGPGARSGARSGAASASGLADLPTDAAAAPGTPSAAGTAPPGAPPPADGHAPKERRIALSGVLGGKERPRRMSCTLVLSVAGALAVATTTAVFFAALNGPEGGGSTAKPPSGHTPPAGSTDPAAGNHVPKGFLGTWNGTVTMANGIPNGTMTSVIKAGDKGDVVVRTTYDVVLLRCQAKAKLLSVTGDALVLQETPDGKQGPACTGNTSTVTYTLGKDGTLTFASDDKRGGTPKATLTRSGG